MADSAMMEGPSTKEPYNYRQDPPSPRLVAAVHDAEQALRYFMRRDEMNAEVHLNLPIGLDPSGPQDLMLDVAHDRRSEVMASVRYSPITFAADAVVRYLWGELYEYPPMSLIPGVGGRRPG